MRGLPVGLATEKQELKNPTVAACHLAPTKGGCAAMVLEVAIGRSPPTDIEVGGFRGPNHVSVASALYG
jgi:hypothetical protein